MNTKTEIVSIISPNKLPKGWHSSTIADLIGNDGLFKDGDWVISADQDISGNVRLIQLADIGDGKFIDKSAKFLTYKKTIELGCSFLKKMMF
jgi:type I restriction enzyme S subunit